LLLALILTMLAGIVLGMGMPTTPAYIIMTALLVPAIMKLGVIEPAAHMFAFYFAILSAITPPVALAVFAAAGIAKADLWQSGWAAVKIGFAGFIVPFMFVYEPALLMIGDWQTILSSCITASAGIVLFAAGLHGYLLTVASYWQRAVLIVAGLCLIKPGLATDLIGAGLAVAIIVTQIAARRAAALKPEIAAE
ncbi:MAG TPA: TRAP transporter large permease subunit, partial [Pseudolabrys sp.]|nr:TRAP transporter large permease subunit [Pseudolabrys sp.]